MKRIDTPLLGYCGEPDAAFPLPLADYLERDREGHVSFCYPYLSGALISTLQHADDALAEVLRRRGRDQFYALKKAAAAIAEARAVQDRVHAQWDAHLAAIRSARADRKVMPSSAILSQPAASNCHA